jgi:hypothetical protein
VVVVVVAYKTIVDYQEVLVVAGHLAVAQVQVVPEPLAKGLLVVEQVPKVYLMWQAAVVVPAIKGMTCLTT